MSSIPTVDHALEEVRDLELAADQADDESVVAACQIVLDRLLDLRLHLPQQRSHNERTERP